MTDHRKFLLDSDYSMDKIVYMTSGSVSVPNTTSEFPGITIAHGLPFKPLAILQWSNTSDFAITNEFRDADYVSTINTTLAGQYYAVHANATNILIDKYNLSGATKTLYYRVFCFQPSDASETSVVPATENQGSNFVLNTDYNYMKLFHAGILTSVSPTFSHNLGYVPRVQIWEQTGTTTSRNISGQEISIAAQSTGVHITDTQIVWLNPTTYDKIHFRCYLDE